MNSPSQITKRLSLEVQGQLARITLNHLPLNVIDFQMMDELLAALQQLEERKEISVMIISGGQRAFSAGVDVAVHTPDLVATMLQKFHGVILALVKFPKITIAEVHGACLGGGAELAMVCDMCFTTSDAKWGFPEITLGCYPPVACTALAALVVAKKAFYAWDSRHLDKGLARAEKIYLEEHMQTEDVKEGIAAWMEKRKPHWNGK